RAMAGDRCAGGGAYLREGVVIRMDGCANRGDGGGHPVDNGGVEAGDQQEGQDADHDQGHDGEPDDAPDQAHHVRRADPMRPPARFAGPDAEDFVEETAIPGEPDRQRLVERIAAAPAEMADRVVALAALAANQVTWMTPRGGLEGARRRARPGGGGGHRDWAAGNRFV